MSDIPPIAPPKAPATEGVVVPPQPDATEKIRAIGILIDTISGIPVRDRPHNRRCNTTQSRLELATEVQKNANYFPTRKPKVSTIIQSIIEMMNLAKTYAEMYEEKQKQIASETKIFRVPFQLNYSDDNDNELLDLDSVTPTDPRKSLLKEIAGVTSSEEKSLAIISNFYEDRSTLVVEKDLLQRMVLLGNSELRSALTLDAQRQEEEKQAEAKKQAVGEQDAETLVNAEQGRPPGHKKRKTPGTPAQPLQGQQLSPFDEFLKQQLAFNTPEAIAAREEKAEKERQERAASERKAQVLMFQHMTNLMAQNQQSRQPLIVGSSSSSSGSSSGRGSGDSFESYVTCRGCSSTVVSTAKFCLECGIKM
jgi:hypothetical protein